MKLFKNSMRFKSLFKQVGALEILSVVTCGVFFLITSVNSFGLTNNEIKWNNLNVLIFVISLKVIYSIAYALKPSYWNNQAKIASQIHGVKARLKQGLRGLASVTKDVSLLEECK